MPRYSISLLHAAINQEIVVVSRYDDVGDGGKIVHRAGGQLEIHRIEIAASPATTTDKPSQSKRRL